jgi:CBS domain-containing protein
MSRAVRVRERMRPGAVAVAWHDSAEAASARMRGVGLDAIPVVDGPRVIGLVERSAASAAQRGGNWLGAVPVASLMRRGAFACRGTDTLEQARAAMDRLDADLLAVVDEAGRVVGVIGRDRVAASARPLMAAAGQPTAGQRLTAGQR